LIDDAHLSASPAHPGRSGDDRQFALSPLLGMVTLTFASWNQIHGWLRRLEGLRGAA